MAFIRVFQPEGYYQKRAYTKHGLGKCTKNFRYTSIKDAQIIQKYRQDQARRARQAYQARGLRKAKPTKIVTVNHCQEKRAELQRLGLVESYKRRNIPTPELFHDFERKLQRIKSKQREKEFCRKIREDAQSEESWRGFVQEGSW